MKWPSSIICIALNGQLGNHKPLDGGFWSNAKRMLINRWGLRIRWLRMHRRLSRAWGSGSLRWNAAYWWLRGWRSRWSPCRVSVLRKARRHLAFRKWSGRSLRWILRRGDCWPGLARYWRVGMASSDARHGQNGARGVGCFFKWEVVGRGMERNPIRKVA